MLLSILWSTALCIKMSTFPLRKQSHNGSRCRCCRLVERIVRFFELLSQPKKVYTNVNYYNLQPQSKKKVLKGTSRQERAKVILFYGTKRGFFSWKEVTLTNQQASKPGRVAMSSFVLPEKLKQQWRSLVKWRIEYYVLSESLVTS